MDEQLAAGGTMILAFASRRGIHLHRITAREDSGLAPIYIASHLDLLGYPTITSRPTNCTQRHVSVTRVDYTRRKSCLGYECARSPHLLVILTSLLSRPPLLLPFLFVNCTERQGVLELFFSLVSLNLGPGSGRAITDGVSCFSQKSGGGNNGRKWDSLVFF